MSEKPVNPTIIKVLKVLGAVIAALIGALTEYTTDFLTKII